MVKVLKTIKFKKFLRIIIFSFAEQVVSFSIFNPYGKKVNAGSNFVDISNTSFLSKYLKFYLCFEIN
jgi:hypothetical protein